MTGSSRQRASDGPSYVLVWPRYLAGGGDTRHVVSYLGASGWRNFSDHDEPRTVLTSADHALHLMVDPDPDRPWWHLRTSPIVGSHEPPWQVTFDARTPVEIIAGLTDALTTSTPAEPADPLQPLAAAGWTVEDLHRRWALSPDSDVSLIHIPVGGERPWYVQVVVQHDGCVQEVWSARFSEHTPLHLIAGFTAALADSAHVVRDSTRLPPLVKSALTIAATYLRFGDVEEDLEARLTTARASRHRATTASPPAPRLSPSPGRRS